MIFALALLLAALVVLAVVVWNVTAWPGVGGASDAPGGAVSILIPARNEEANIAGCLEAVGRQGVVVAEILVYDDHSTDATAQLVTDYVARDGRVRLVGASELPAGWCGKNFACARLAEEARSEWLLYLDADTRLAEGGAARLVAEAGARQVSMLSVWPALTMLSFWERALMPLLNFVVFSLFPAPLSLLRQDASLGLVHGACILARRENYFRVGGHAAVRGEIFEDQRLAHLWRERGERGICLDGRGVVSVRMYSSFAEIRGGFQKNFFPAFRHEANFWLFLLLHAAVFLAPFVLLPLTGSWVVGATTAAVLVSRALLAARFHHPVVTVLLHPLAEVILIWVGLSSWWRCKSGKGVEWKGRRYHEAAGGR